MALPRFIAEPDFRAYLGFNYLVLDFETEVADGRYGSALDSRNSLALACWSDSTGRVVSHWGSEFNQQSLCERIELVDFIVAHNAKYELGWLARCGVDTSELLVFDTKLAEYVLLGNLAAGDTDNGVKPVSTSLDDCCIRRGMRPKDRIVDLWMKHGIPVSKMPRKWVEDRCRQDVASTHNLFLNQRDRLARTNRLGVLYTRCTFTPVLAAIEQEKIHLDASRVYSAFDDATQELGTLECKLTEITGGINWRSPKQVADYLYSTLGFAELAGRDGKPKRTPNGQRLTNAKSLVKLRVSTDAQRQFLDLKKAIGQVGFSLSKNLNYFKEICDDTDRGNCFTAEFHQAVTATHRIACSGIKTVLGNSVQLTNVPRNLKYLFSAKRDGWLIAEADGAQLEFRVAAFLGNDPQAREDITNGIDIHCLAGAEATRRSYDTVRDAYTGGEQWAKDLRQWAKIRTFRPLYGGSSGTPDEQRWYEAFKRRYSVLAKTQQDWVYEVLRTKQLVTRWGLRYYFPHVSLSSKGYCNVGNAIYNYPIQALATAEIIPVAVTAFWHLVHSEGLSEVIRVVNTVHDSVVCEIHPDNCNDFRRIAKLAFGPFVYDYLRHIYNIEFDIPLGTGIKIGTHWGEGEEEKYEYLKEST